jgi:hypothetical protein
MVELTDKQLGCPKQPTAVTRVFALLPLLLLAFLQTFE